MGVEINVSSDSICQLVFFFTTGGKYGLSKVIIYMYLFVSIGLFEFLEKANSLGTSYFICEYNLFIHVDKIVTNDHRVNHIGSHCSYLIGQAGYGTC